MELVQCKTDSLYRVAAFYMKARILQIFLAKMGSSGIGVEA
jgi:hypothetical protein